MSGAALTAQSATPIPRLARFTMAELNGLVRGERVVWMDPDRGASNCEGVIASIGTEDDRIRVEDDLVVISRADGTSVEVMAQELRRPNNEVIAHQRDVYLMALHAIALRADGDCDAVESMGFGAATHDAASDIKSIVDQAICPVRTADDLLVALGASDAVSDFWDESSLSGFMYRALGPSDEVFRVGDEQEYVRVEWWLAGDIVEVANDLTAEEAVAWVSERYNEHCYDIDRMGVAA